MAFLLNFSVLFNFKNKRSFLQGAREVMYEFSKLSWTSERPEFFEIEMLNENPYKIEIVRELYKSFENQSCIKYL